MSGDVTYQALKRLTYLPERDAGDNGSVIAGQEYDDVYINGGEINNIDINNAGNITCETLSTTGLISAEGGYRGVTGLSSGFGGRITQPSTGTGDAILQFTNYAQTIQLATVQGTNDGDLILNPNTGRDILCNTRLAPSSTLGIKGTTTNDSAQAGSIGELIESEIPVVSAVSLTSGIGTNITSIPLQAGMYLVWGNIVYLPAGTTTMSRLTSCLNTTSATVPAAPNAGGTSTLQLTFTLGVAQVQDAGMRTLKLSAPATLYLIARPDFAVSTMTGYGYLGAIRVR